jgi:hypothetical protein
VIKKGNIGNKAVDGETTTGDEMDIDDSLVLDIQEDMEEGSKIGPFFPFCFSSPSH